MRVLLVEDDHALAQGMIMRLKHMGYQTELCTSGTQALQALANSHFDLMILDLGLPDGFALPVIQNARKTGHFLPILVLTAQDALETKLAALNFGADDFLVKPIDVLELEARIRVVSRRFTTRRDDILVVANLELHLARMACYHLGKLIPLTPREFLLLKSFMLHTDRILSRQQLEELCHGWEGEAESNAMEVHIHNLRKKLHPQLIKTIRGVGYMMNSRYENE